MRALLVTSVGVTCAAALTLPLAAPASSAPVLSAASARPPSLTTEPGTDTTDTSGTTAPDTTTTSDTTAPDGAEPRAAKSAAAPAGSTQSLPLAPLAVPSNRVAGAPAVQGLPQRDARPFSLVGVVWDDAEAELHGTVQVRTRATGTTRWSDWQDVETHNADHAADLGSAEREGRTVRGATAPLWVGDSDGVEVRVRPESPAAPESQDRAATPVPLPEGMRLEARRPRRGPGAGARPGRPRQPGGRPRGLRGHPADRRTAGGPDGRDRRGLGGQRGSGGASARASSPPSPRRRRRSR